MKYRVKITVVVTSLLILCTAGGMVVAQQDDEAQVREKQALTERLKARRDAAKIRLSDFQKNRLKTRCKAAQGLIARIDNRVKGLETSRTQVYDNLIDRLTKLSERLQNNGLDVTELNAQIEVLKAKIDTYKTDLTNFKQAVADLVAVDCQADPDGFHASLEVARELHKKLRTTGAEIKAHLKGPIKQALQELRQQLADSEEPGQGGDE